MKKRSRALLAAILLGAALTASGCGILTEFPDSSSGEPFAVAEAAPDTNAKTDSAADTSAEPESTSAEHQTADTSGADTSSDSASAGATTSESSAAATTQTLSTQTQSSTTAAQTTASSKVTSANTTVSSSASSSSTTTTTASTASYSAGQLTQADKTFLDDCVFVGDSICSGLKVYHILPDKNVVAKGCVAARSIFDYTFSVGGANRNVVDALSILKPKYVIFSMGMNDINMTNAERYCTNYQNLLSKVQAVLPDAKLYVASITPITTNCTFSTNTKIDSYNTAVKNYLAQNYPSWGYVDIASGLKNQWNGLISSYSSGDGIHLAPAAYTVILKQVCQQLNPGGSGTASVQ